VFLSFTVAMRNGQFCVNLPGFVGIQKALRLADWERVADFVSMCSDGLRAPLATEQKSERKHRSKTGIGVSFSVVPANDDCGKTRQMTHKISEEHVQTLFITIKILKYGIHNEEHSLLEIPVLKRSSGP
jgi:hypothetical protein